MQVSNGLIELPVEGPILSVSGCACVAGRSGRCIDGLERRKVTTLLSSDTCHVFPMLIRVYFQLVAMAFHIRLNSTFFDKESATSSI